MLDPSTEVDFDNYKKRAEFLKTVFDAIENFLSLDCNGADFKLLQGIARDYVSVAFDEPLHLSGVRITAPALIHSIRYMSSEYVSKFDHDKFEPFFRNPDLRELPDVKKLLEVLEQEQEPSVEITESLMRFVDEVLEKYRSEPKPKDRIDFLPSAEVYVRGLLLSVVLVGDKIPDKKLLTTKINAAFEYGITSWHKLWHALKLPNYNDKESAVTALRRIFSVLRDVISAQQTDVAFANEYKETATLYVIKTFDECRGTKLSTNLINLGFIDVADYSRLRDSMNKYRARERGPGGAPPTLIEDLAECVKHIDKPVKIVENKMEPSQPSTAKSRVQAIARISLNSKPSAQLAIITAKELLLGCCLKKSYCDEEFRESFNIIFENLCNLKDRKNRTIIGTDKRN